MEKITISRDTYKALCLDLDTKESIIDALLKSNKKLRASINPDAEEIELQTEEIKELRKKLEVISVYKVHTEQAKKQLELYEETNDKYHLERALSAIKYALKVLKNTNKKFDIIDCL